MWVCVVKDGSMEYFLERIKPSLPKVDLVLFSYKILPNINYESEIAGETQNIKSFLNLSKELNCVICVGSYFELLGEKNASILVCDSGELLGIADGLSSIKKEKIKQIKLFMTKMGSMAVLVTDDLLNKKLRSLITKFEPRILINIADHVNIENWNETLQKQAKESNTNFISLTNKTTFYKEKDSSEVKLNFCEFFTKEFKI